MQQSVNNVIDIVYVTVNEMKDGQEFDKRGVSTVIHIV